MTTTTEPTNELATLDKIRFVERRIHALKGDIEGLFENYISDLILLPELRTTLAVEMVDNAFPPSSDDKTPTLSENSNVE